MKPIRILFVATISTLIIISMNAPVLKADSSSYDYVIITTEELKDSVIDFKKSKEELGFSVNIVTVSWIYNQYSGKDDPERIRNFLIDKYNEWEIKFVLIVGSIDSVPMRYCYPDPANHISNNWIVPTDYYYAELTGDWDTDNDGYFGEGKNNSNAPLSAGPFNSTTEQKEFFYQFWDDKVEFDVEVYVGRLPIDDKNILEKIFNKTINFEKSNESWKKRALLLGALDGIYMGDLEDAWINDQGYYMDWLTDKIFDPNGFLVTRLYEKEGLRTCPLECDDAINEKNVIEYWNQGYGIVILSGHGSSLYSTRTVWAFDDGDGIPESNQSEIKYYNYISIGNITKLNDSRPSIVFSNCCNNAYPEIDNNIGNSLMEKGAVAFIGATRILHSGGYPNPDEKYDGNLAICRQFFHYLIEENQTCGEALYNSKMYCDKPDQYGASKYNSLNNMYGLNLYGDPSIKLLQIHGEDISIPDEGESKETPGFELIFFMLSIALILFLKRRE